MLQSQDVAVEMSSRVEDGSATLRGKGGVIFGSQTEGLNDVRGHEEAAWKQMQLHGQPVGVHVARGRHREDNLDPIDALLCIVNWK